MTDPQKLTFAGVFLSGADKVEQNGRNDGIIIEKSHDPEAQGLHLQSTSHMSSTSNAFGENEIIKDPPCVMPFEDTDDMETAPLNPFPNIQAYWKPFATYMDQWPTVMRNKSVMKQFEMEYGREMGKELVQRTSKRSDNRSRSYVCISQYPVGVRSAPTQSEDSMTSDIIYPGDILLVQEVRSSEDESSTDYLQLGGMRSGWVFSRKDGVLLFSEMRMMEVGPWWYKVVCSEMAEIRTIPLHADWGRTGWLVSPGEYVNVTLRAHVCGYDFLLLADGRGWMFIQKPGTPKNTRDPDHFVMSECETDFMLDDMAMLQSLITPTNEVVEIGKWTYVVNQNPVLALGSLERGVWLVPGDIVKVNKRAIASGSLSRGSSVQSRRWLRLSDGRGWVPQVFEDNTEALTLREDEDLAYPQWYQAATL
eukprot:CAMPEP_0178432368 /NCGR_PEP_ID=MMETSP0689_2-20121128/32344_1 /TAXON_ID=160604 /ORGANISM="Amphidinium massartii, Strain CS-259" /LENGTH=420 /DNA_ID=CAMNT_0020054343 /DNA_START=9 /DNA_END=1268 /DNA_ORIENTATION=-